MLLNIIIGLIVIGITVVIQGYGTMFWIHSYVRYQSKLSREAFKQRSLRILILTAVFLISIHLIQSSLWALTYLLLPEITEFETIEKAIYFSLVTFSTLGYGEITIASDSRILAGLEAINGIILIGWSTAFMFSVFQEIMKRNIHNRSVNSK